MQTPLATRIRLKIKRIFRELRETPAERDFRRQWWPSIDSVEGWLLPEEGKWLFKIARSLPSEATLVEIGSYKGRSTCCLALGCGASKKKVFAIDTFDGGPNLPKANSLPDFEANLARLGVAGSVESIVALSTEAARTWGKPIDFLFVDGSHLIDDVLADFAGFFPYVVPGGIVAFHDVRNPTWPGVGEAWRKSIQPQLTNTGYCESLGYGRKPFGVLGSSRLLLSSLRHAVQRRIFGQS